VALAVFKCESRIWKKILCLFLATLDHGAQVSGSDRLKDVPLDREKQRGSNDGRFIP
jgi:hypothetical protein